MKYCPRCTTTKPKLEFYKCKTRGDGLKSICSVCSKAEKKAWTIKNPVKVKEHEHTAYYKDLDKTQEKARKYYARRKIRDPESILK